MPEPEDELAPEQHPAAERIAKREEAKAQRELAVVDAGLSLSKDQRTALLAVAGDDLTPETLKAKAEALGFTTKEEAPPPPPEPDPNLVAQEQMAQAAAGSAPPPPPVDGAKAAFEKALYVDNPGELNRLRVEVESQLRASGYQIGSFLDHDGTFRPS